MLDRLQLPSKNKCVKTQRLSACFVAGLTGLGQNKLTSRLVSICLDSKETKWKILFDADKDHWIRARQYII